jgi:DNA adenine methylase
MEGVSTATQSLFASDESPMKIGSLVPWFGSKRTLAPRIVGELGEHSAYWEPFAGSMAVLLAKPQSSMETVNDLHGDLTNLARVIKDAAAGPAFYRRLRRTLMCKTFCDEASERFRARGNVPAGDVLDVDRAYDYFVSSWMGRNGVSGTVSFNQGFARRFTKNGGHAAKRWCSAVDSIPAWRRRMRNLTILNEDSMPWLESKIEDSVGVAIYADPPYVTKGASYVHDFEGESAHRSLAAALGRFRKTRVVVSYYDCPLVRELYPDASRGGQWTWVDCTMTKSLVSQGMRDKGNKVEAPEVLIVNGPSYTKGVKA